MVTKKKSANEKAKRSRVKLGKLNLGRETIKDLSPEDKSRIKGGAAKLTLSPQCIVETWAGCPIYPR